MEYSETPPDLQDIVDWLDEPELAISNTNAKATDAMVRLYDEPNDDLLSIDYITIDPEDDTMYYQVYVYVSEATSITGELTDEEDGFVETWDLSLVAGWNVVIVSENDTSNTATVGTTVPDGLEGAWFAEPDDESEDDDSESDLVELSGTGSISVTDGEAEVESAALSDAVVISGFDDEADVWIHEILLYGNALEIENDSLSSTGPFVYIDIDEYQNYDEPQSETYEFGGGSGVTEDEGFFVEFGVLTESTLDGYQGGDGIFSDAASDGTAYAYHIYDDDPTFDNITPSTLVAGFTGGAPSEGGTLSIELTADGKTWEIDFTFEATNGE